MLVKYDYLMKKLTPRSNIPLVLTLVYVLTLLLSDIFRI